MGLPPGRTDVDGPEAPNATPSGRSAGRRMVSRSCAAAAACYVGVVAVLRAARRRRHTPLTAVTSALADGDLRVAASVSPSRTRRDTRSWSPRSSPPSAPRWGRLLVHPGGEYPVPQVVATAERPGRSVRADAGGAVPAPWYRAQGVLGVASWLVLALGALAVLRAAWADSAGAPGRRLLAFLAFLPAASSAMVQFYHPQDVVSLGLALAGLSQTLRARWGLAGCSSAPPCSPSSSRCCSCCRPWWRRPGRRSRLTMAGAAAAVFAAGLLPFLVVDPRATSRT